jgi:hypothetical protein
MIMHRNLESMQNKTCLHCIIIYDHNLIKPKNAAMRTDYTYLRISLFLI